MLLRCRSRVSVISGRFSARGWSTFSVVRTVVRGSRSSSAARHRVYPRADDPSGIQRRHVGLAEIVWRLGVMLAAFVGCTAAALMQPGGDSLTNLLYAAAYSYGGGTARMVMGPGPGAPATVTGVAALFGLMLSRPLIAYHTLALLTDLTPQRRWAVARITS